MVSSQSNNKSFSDNKIVIIVISIFLLFGLPYAINFLFQNCELIETSISDSDWLSFWSNYIPGILTCVFAYWAIVEANRNNRNAIEEANKNNREAIDNANLMNQEAIDNANKNSQIAIEQQYKIIAYQENKEILNKFTVVLKQINDCFRIFEVDSVRYSFDIQNLSSSKNKILQLTSNLECVFIEWSMLINFYNNYASCFQQYKDIWDKARVLYSNYTDELLIYIEKYNLDNYQKVYDIMSKIDFSNKALGEIANGFVEQFAKEFSYSDEDRNKLESDRNQLLKYQKQLLKYSEYSLKQLDGQLRQKVSLS